MVKAHCCWLLVVLNAAKTLNLKHELQHTTKTNSLIKVACTNDFTIKVSQAFQDVDAQIIDVAALLCHK
jgi:hypothetical protein